MQGCQLSIQGRVPRVVKSLPQWQTLTELETLKPGTHLLETVPQPVGAHLAEESSSRRMFSSYFSTSQGFCFRNPWKEMFFRHFRRFCAQPGSLWSFTRSTPQVTPGNLELATPVVAATGSPPCAVPFALISMCGKVGLEGRLSLWAGADWCARCDLGFLSRSHLRTGCQ